MEYYKDVQTKMYAVIVPNYINTEMALEENDSVVVDASSTTNEVFLREYLPRAVLGGDTNEVLR